MSIVWLASNASSITGEGGLEPEVNLLRPGFLFFFLFRWRLFASPFEGFGNIDALVEGTKVLP